MAITTEKLIPTPSKTLEQRQATLAAFSDLMGAKPLGTQRGESFGMPHNYRPPTADIFVVNHSRVRPFRRKLVAVSDHRGADEALAMDKTLRENYNADALYRAVAAGRDMSIYSNMETHAVGYNLRIPGGPDGQGGSHEAYLRAIPPCKDPDGPPLEIKVPDGTWDNYCGNYDRMHGYNSPKDWGVKSPDPVIINQEKARIAQFWKGRKNPVFRITVDGESEDLHNEFGYLEFIRRSIVPVQEQIDKEYLTALDLVESM